MTFIDRDVLHGGEWHFVRPAPFGRRKRSRLLTPLGWFVILAVVSVALGAALGFAV